MRYLLAACCLGLALGVVLGLLLVTLGDALESFASKESPGFLRSAASGVRVLQSRVIELVDTWTAAYPDESPTLPSRLSRDPGSRTNCAAC